MLLRVGIENCFSFKERQELSLEASKIQKLKEHVYKIKNKKILLATAAFGANGSGKSNLIKAIDFSRELVLNGTDRVNFNKKHFRIDPDYVHRPGIFEFRIILDNDVYDYNFKVSYLSQCILFEKLVINNKLVFERTYDLNDTKIKLGTSKISKNIENRINIYVDDFQRSENSKYKFFLNEIASRAPGDIGYMQCYIKLFEWFKRITVIYPSSRFVELYNMASSNKYHDDFEVKMKKFNTGILEITGEEKEFDEIFSKMPLDISRNLKNELSEALLDEDAHSISVRIRDQLYQFYKDVNGTIKAKSLQLNHGNSDDLFDYLDESDGTQRLFDLIPLLIHCPEDSLILIDEIDRSLHPVLVKNFIEELLPKLKKNNSQLIITTHSSILFDLDIFRADEICIIDKDPAKMYSFITRLNSYNVRFDKKVQKDYLHGEYGGIYHLKNGKMN